MPPIAPQSTPKGARSARLPHEQGLLELQRSLRIGDVVFIRIPWSPFRQIADTTRTWTNHVGLVSHMGREGPVIAESRVPVASRTPWSRFVRRSERGRVAVLRLARPLSGPEVQRLQQAVHRRLGRLYDTGFNLQSRRQFCSRFVHEVLLEATGEHLGQITTFRDLLAEQPNADLRLWKLWYFGRIPWNRTTITPASLYRSETLQVLFDGKVLEDDRGGICNAR